LHPSSSRAARPVNLRSRDGQLDLPVKLTRLACGVKPNGYPDAMTSVRPRQRSTAARPSDDELLDAAREVFAARGFAAATMSAIADAGNSTKPTLYAHFGDKDALYARLLQREADLCRGLLFAAYQRNADLDLRAQVYADTEAFFDYARAHPAGIRLLFGADFGSAAARVRERLVADVDRQIYERICGYTGRPTAQRNADEWQVAAMLVGVAVAGARHAIDNDLDLTRACVLACAFSAAALDKLAG
jgi:AcrR family transcriptional regulator